MYSKKCNITLPKLIKDEHTAISPPPPRTQRQNSISSINSNQSSVHSNESSNSSNSHSNNNHGNNNNGSKSSRLRKILHSFSHKSSQQKKSNSDNIERYLRYCVNDLNIQKCSLFKEFLQPQREEDNVIPKQLVQSYVQQETSLNVNVDLATSTPLSPPCTREIIRSSKKSASAAAASASGAATTTLSSPITPPPDMNNTKITNDDTIEEAQDDESVIRSLSLSYNSFASHQQEQQPQTEARQPDITTTSSILSATTSSSDNPVTIQDFQLIKVIGRGCMGKVSSLCSFII